MYMHKVVVVKHEKKMFGCLLLDKLLVELQKFKQFWIKRIKEITHNILRNFFRNFFLGGGGGVVGLIWVSRVWVWCGGYMGVYTVRCPVTALVKNIPSFITPYRQYIFAYWAFSRKPNIFLKNDIAFSCMSSFFPSSYDSQDHLFFSRCKTISVWFSRSSMSFFCKEEETCYATINKKASLGTTDICL
jgi:hypothetical protein